MDVNVATILRTRELSGRGARICRKADLHADTAKALARWAEADMLRRCSATYCELTPPPRSTIAAAFSPDGRLLASTHGDHTVKIICCRTGRCLKVLTGHRRTPWVVRFHPSSPRIVASGSLDYEVRLWDVTSGNCIHSRSFGKPIASLAFHSKGDVLAVASGHKLYLWEYSRRPPGPLIIALKTRRSLRAVHFHPHGAPLLMTAEVTDPSAPHLLPIAVAAEAGASGSAPFVGARATSPLVQALWSAVGPAAAQEQNVHERRQDVLPEQNAVTLPATGVANPAAPTDASAAGGVLISSPAQPWTVGDLMRQHVQQLAQQSRGDVASTSGRSAEQALPQHNQQQAQTGERPQPSLADGRQHPSAGPSAPVQIRPRPASQPGGGVGTLQSSQNPLPSPHRPAGPQQQAGASAPAHAGRNGAPSMHSTASTSARALPAAMAPSAAAAAANAAASRFWPMQPGSFPPTRSMWAYTPPPPPAPTSIASLSLPQPRPAHPPGVNHMWVSPEAAAAEQARGRTYPWLPRRSQPEGTPAAAGYWHPVPRRAPPLDTPVRAVDAVSADHHPAGGSDPWSRDATASSPAANQQSTAVDAGDARPEPGSTASPLALPANQPPGLAEGSSQQLELPDGSNSLSPADQSMHSMPEVCTPPHPQRPPNRMPPPVPHPGIRRHSVDLGGPQRSAAFSAQVSSHRASQMSGLLESFRRPADRGEVRDQTASRAAAGLTPQSSFANGQAAAGGLPLYPVLGADAGAQLGLAAAARAPAILQQIMGPNSADIALSQPGGDPATGRTAGAAHASARGMLPNWGLIGSRTDGSSGSGDSSQPGSGRRRSAPPYLDRGPLAGSRFPQFQAAGSSATPVQQHQHGSLSRLLQSHQDQPGSAGDHPQPSMPGRAAFGANDATPVAAQHSAGPASASSASPGSPHRLHQQNVEWLLRDDAASPPAAAADAGAVAAGLAAVNLGQPADLVNAIEGHWMGSAPGDQPAQATPAPAPMPALPPSMVNMGWEYPAHLLQPDMAALTPAGATQPGNAQQQASGTAAVAAAANQGAAAVVRMSAAAANIIGQEQPCRVKLRLWRYSLTTPVQALDFAALTITDAVLCSEMGVHFSPCGRFMAACVACQDQLSSTAPQPQSLHLPASSAVPTPNIVYEVRIYSVEQCTFGKVLHARRIQAAHCLTSVQFSPSSEHLLLAYGRRHISLLRSLVAEGGTIIPVHTILEVYRVADMSLVRVLPTAEDEVNAAAFHPFEGGGIAYGTKEGRLRILRHDRAPQPHPASPSLRSLEDELLEADSVVHVGASSDDDA